VSGAIAFVGLVAPHLVRRACGFDPVRILLPSALTGAALLLAADIAIRIVGGPNEIRLGVITALIGAPFFIYMIFRERHALEDAAA
jgi:iron complex transport system permease protein